VTVAAGVFAPGHLGELSRLVPFEMVDDVLATTGTAQSRTRLLPARVTVYLLLAGCLFAEVGYRQVWQKLTSGLTSLGLAAPTGSALRQARQRLGPALLRALFDLLRGPAATSAARKLPLLHHHRDGSWQTILAGRRLRVIEARIAITTTLGTRTSDYRLLTTLLARTPTPPPS
jgi:hypothetical protein